MCGKVRILLISLLLTWFGVIHAQLSPIEETFVSVPQASRAYEHLAFYSSKPHVAGTIEDYENALYTLEVFKKNGIEAEIVPLKVLLSKPVSRYIKMIEPYSYEPEMKERSLKEDITSTDSRNVMTYNAYSGSGNITSSLIYVNYGTLEDFQYLESQGVDLKGKICIARYGGVFRGNKVFFAEQYGVAGMILYSDPIDDGFLRGKVYPEGPWRPSFSVQRGSCSYLTTCPGDPGKPERCGNTERTRPSIPVVPISSDDAQPLLASLTGKTAPQSWQGGLSFEYKIGGNVKLNLFVQMEEKYEEIWNVIATIKGTDTKRRVVIGNHRDAWTFGAFDPNSGTSTMMEVARGFGKLLSMGWKPKRTIQFGSWDGEEMGLIGSTEWGEINAQALKNEAVAYINVDTAASGSNFGASASPSLASLIREKSKYVINPGTGKPLFDSWSGGVGVLGSGSDFAVFVEYLGVSSIDMSFSGPGATYHSIFDSMDYMRKYADPNFEYHRAMAQLWGIVTLELADSTILPFNYQETATELFNYLQTLQKLVDNSNANVDLSPIESSCVAFREASNKINEELLNCKSNTLNCSSSVIESLNNRLVFAERRFMSENGLPKRPWFKNVISAPGYLTGYAAETYPGVADAIRDRNWVQANEQVKVISEKILNAANFLATGR